MSAVTLFFSNPSQSSQDPDKNAETKAAQESFKEYTEQEFLEKLILPVFKKYPEISWFADIGVDVTKEAPGTTEKSGWTQLFMQYGLIKHQKGKYIELERMLTSIVCFSLFYDGTDAAYEKFVSVQKNKDERLTKESFRKIHQLARDVASNKELYNAVITMLVVSDLGKTPEARKKAAAYKLNQTDNDDFVEALLTQEKKVIEDILPSFSELPKSVTELLIKANSATKVHLGHVLHLEGGHRMFAKFEKAIKEGDVSENILNFAFLIQICDVAAAAAQVTYEGSLTLMENPYQGYQYVFEALKVIQKGGSSYQSILFYLNQRGKMLGIEPSTPFNRVLIRLSCMLRLYSKEDGDMLQASIKILNEEQQKVLVEQFGMEETEFGINTWARNPTYAPAVLVNVARFQDAKEPKEVKIKRALEAAACLAYLLQSYSENDENRNSIEPLNLNALAGIVSKQPELFVLHQFDMKHFKFEKTSIVLALGYEKKLEAKTESEEGIKLIGKKP